MSNLERPVLRINLLPSLAFSITRQRSTSQEQSSLRGSTGLRPLRTVTRTGIEGGRLQSARKQYLRQRYALVRGDRKAITVKNARLCQGTYE